jgi:type I restriction enzyme M protein
MDVKHCLLHPGRLVAKWRKGDGVCTLNELVDVCWPLHDDADESAPASVAPEFAGARYLRVRYDGFAESGEEVSDSSEAMFRVRAGDIVISHINAVHGAIAVVPEELDGSAVTSEFTVCRPKNGIDPRLVWSLLRSPEARADFLITATGIGRTRVKTEQAKKIDLPTVDEAIATPLVQALRRAEELEREARKLRQEARIKFEAEFDLANERAREIIAAFKPPD